MPKKNTKTDAAANTGIAEADQQNAKRRDQREASPDGMTAAERALQESDAREVTVFRAAPGGSYQWRDKDSTCVKRYMSREQCVKAALKANPDAKIVHEPDPPKPKTVASIKPKKKRKTVDGKPRVSAEAARVEGAARTKRALEAKAEAKAAGGKTPAKSPAKATPTDPRSRNHVSLLDAAATVLADAGEPMRTKAIVEAAIERGLWKPGTGKTPHATLYAAMTREIATKGDEARFRKADRGLFEAAGKEG